MRGTIVACGVAAALLTAAPPALSADKSSPGGGKIRRDPQGQKGISPYAEQLAKGRRAFANNDFAGAIAAFRQAVARDAKAPLGYVLLAQAQMADEQWGAAGETLESAERAQGAEAERAKLLQVGGVHAERMAGDAAPDTTPKARQALWSKAEETWAAYEVFAVAHPQAAPHKDAASERKEQVRARLKRDADYAIVVKRIEDNAAERAKKKK